MSSTPSNLAPQIPPQEKKKALALARGDVDAARVREGWRMGHPEEDPEKTKRWGFLSAKPSEFLVRMRGGKVVTSGQGASCFKWPWDSVAVVPTTVQRLHFTADQVTSEKVGVKVTGIAVYRIAEPMIAFRMLNFSYAERAQEKLASMLEEMFVGAVRRLVANLTVEECLTRRKDALGRELMREIAPVVSGQGQLSDGTQRGWGVVLDSIEIQDVRVLSAAVFANMQARFRNEQERLAREAELAKQRSLKLQEAETERAIELARTASQTEVRQKKLIADEQARLEKQASDARVESERLANERAAREEALAAMRQHELQKVALEAQIAEAKLRAQAERARAEMEEAAARQQAALLELSHAEEVVQSKVRISQAKLTLAELENRAMALDAEKVAHAQRLELERLTQVRAIENDVSSEVIQLAVAQKLPELAQAFQQKMGEVHVTAVDGANPFGYVAAAVEGVMGLARSAGLELPKKG
ncbi:MAG: hypothetical protein K1X89_00825 [Myxococcaceae bacterium]|nr:hypothetical protein [Myxococcaceae bacterium]